MKFALVFLSATLALAQQPAIDLKTFEQYALSSNPTLQQVHALVNESAAEARQAGLPPNPVIGYQGEQIRGGSYGGGEQGAFVQQTFVLGNKLGLRRDVFEQQKHADEIGIEEQRCRVLSEVGQQFYFALATQKLVDIRNQLLAIANDARETARQLANVGQADTPDVLQSEVEADQAALDYTAAQRMYAHQFRGLAALVGKPQLPLAPLAGDLENVPSLDTDHIAENSPSIKRAKQDVVRAEAQLKSAKREAIPDLDIHAGLQDNFEPLPNAVNRPVGVQGFVTAGIALPIWNRNQGGIAAAQADLERAQAEVTRMQLALTQTTQPLIEAYLTGREQAARYKDEMIPRATSAYRLYQGKYQQMAVSYSQVILSQRTLAQLQVGYINSLQQLWMATIALQCLAENPGQYSMRRNVTPR